MRHRRLIKLLIFAVIIIAALGGFHQFMTYDRGYDWSKELEEEVNEVGKVHGFEIAQESEIGVDSIKLPTKRAIKIKIQKILSKVGLMDYGYEFGKKILLVSKASNEFFVCKGWCSGDYVIGIEIEFRNIGPNTLTGLKKDFDKYFINYKIVWTKL